MTILWLVGASCIGWFISSLVGGGSPLILIPVMSLFLEASAIPPIITIGMLFGNGQRVGLYWQEIDLELTRWYLPGAILGAIAGVFLFTKLQLEWLTLLLGIILITSIFSYRLAEILPLFQVKSWYFLPVGFIYAFLSGLMGSTGPLLNPLYLNYGLEKEKMIGTKSAHVLVVHIVKIFTYLSFGIFSSSIIVYGLIIGIGAFPGNWLGQKVLVRMETTQFRKIAIAFVLISGFMLIWNQRHILSFIY
ncbi:sulfite exporter TauE/SafE family protein [Euhalothece natronophila Z-M001]|uniref:Probable membrane transporter protein n=1 Tax=Euhalothece natronophila Z-M001 TaxID=522448 RepID=A0A5B8NPV1_9CHRO|nr:sulfite exporter TauE/SafE family protein [Euhalothece natronophila]QDZ41058.1 sulfite exporter TauE/SafE family protein [Euhalothece natronophila Z-M001]